MTNCNLCPRNCNINRKYKKGYCQAPNYLVVAKAYLHKWEEPIITGKKGSGTIFFSFCNLKCIFCQNYKISTNNYGKRITIKRFSDICIELQNKGATNINLVTPTHFVPWIIKGLKLAKKKGLIIPIVYNSSAYENIDTIKSLKGLIDVYIPDLKYYDNNIALKYSNAPNYYNNAILAIKEMYKQVGKPIIKNGIITKGLIIRHLMLPTHLDDSKKIVDYIYKEYKNNVYISIMSQYTPIKELKYKELNKKISNKEYYELIDYAYKIGVRKAFTQESESSNKLYIPDFNGEGIKK